MPRSTKKFLKTFFLLSLLSILDKCLANNDEKASSNPSLQQKWTYFKKERQLVMTGPEEGYYEWKNQTGLHQETLKNEFFDCMEQQSFHSTSSTRNHQRKEKCQKDQNTIYKRTYDGRASPLPVLSLSSQEKWLPPSLAVAGKEYTTQVGTFYYAEDKYTYPESRPSSILKEEQDFQRELFYRCVEKTETVKINRQPDGTWKQMCIREEGKHSFKHARTIAPSFLTFPSDPYHYEGEKHLRYPLSRKNWGVPSLLDQHTLAIQFKDCLQKEGTYTLRRHPFHNPSQWQESCEITKSYGNFFYRRTIILPPEKRA